MYKISTLNKISKVGLSRLDDQYIITDKTEEAFILNEGTKVTIVDSVSVSATQGNNEKWYDVRADNTHRAWISSSSIEII